MYNGNNFKQFTHMAILSYGQVGWRSAVAAPVSGIDADAQAFITAASITDNTQKSAINTLVTQLKTYGIWTKLKAVYPFVGGNASAHKFNLKDPRDLDAAFRLVFNGGWTHSSTGALPNGINGNADTKLNTKNVLTPNNLSIGLYTNTNRAADTSPSRIAYGNADNNTTYVPLTQLYLRAGTNQLISDLGDYNYGRVSSTNTSTAGFYVNTRTSATLNKTFKSGVLFGSSTTNNPTNTLPNSDLFIACFNDGSVRSSYEIINYQFFYTSDGLTDTEAANFYTAVQTFQTTLGRQAGVPIVADTDAQAFLDAAVITDQTQATAINTLVTDLKSANIWTKMKAIYPFVGGTATTHKYNLKDPRDLDAAYRLVFNGGWTHSSTGALPNGSNGYANTFLTPSTHLGDNSAHISYYSRTSSTSDSDNYVVGADSPSGFFALILRNNTKYFKITNTSTAYEGAGYSGLLSTNGFFVGTQDVNNIKLFRNNTNIAQNSATDNNPRIGSQVYIGGSNSWGSPQTYTTAQSAFASIGDGLTDAEATAFYNAVQAYQTSLGRQV